MRMVLGTVPRIATFEDGIWLDPAAPDNQSFAYGIHFHLAPDNWGATCAFPGNGTVQSGVSETVEPSPSDTIFVMTKGRTESDPTNPQDRWGWVLHLGRVRLDERLPGSGRYDRWEHRYRRYARRASSPTRTETVTVQQRRRSR